MPKEPYVLNFKKPEDSPEQIASKLNSLTSAINVEVIAGALPRDEFEKYKKNNDKIVGGYEDRIEYNIKNGRKILSDMRYNGVGLSKVSHDTTLTGDGTEANPLKAAATGSLPASSVTFVPYSTTGATNVQSAISELTDEKLDVTRVAVSTAVMAEQAVGFTLTGGTTAKTLTLDTSITASNIVTGPSSSTDNAIARFDGTTGKLVQNSDVLVRDLAAGAISIYASPNAGAGNYFSVLAGDATSGNNAGGNMIVLGGAGNGSGAGGAAYLQGNQGGATGAGGAAIVQGGAGGATSGNGGASYLLGGNGTAGNSNGGNCRLEPGVKSGSGINGQVYFIKPGANYGGSIIAEDISEWREFRLPNKSGTFAMTSDITGAVVKSTAGTSAGPATSSTQTITHGLGATPSIIRLSGISQHSYGINSPGTSKGVYNSSGNHCIYSQAWNDGTYTSNTYSVRLDYYASGGPLYMASTGVVQNITATTFDIVWTNTGNSGDTTGSSFIWEAQ